MKVIIKEIGNKRISTTCSYISKEKNKKAKKLLIKILSVAFPEINDFIICLNGWSSSFDSRQFIVTYHKIKIVCEISTIHENRLYFSLLPE